MKVRDYFNLERNLVFYGSYHSNPVNIGIHLLCIWNIAWSAVYLLQFTPVISNLLPEPIVENYAFFILSLYIIVFLLTDFIAGTLASILIIGIYFWTLNSVQNGALICGYNGWNLALGFLSKMGRLDGKVALITAAAQGIGRETALLFAKEGAKVYATDINEALLKELSNHEGISIFKLDVTNKEDVMNAKDSITESIDILFNCAGYVHHGSILDCDEDSWKRSFEINVDSMYYMCKAIVSLRNMIENKKGGSIINMSSICSSIKGLPNRFAYGTTKAAVIGFTKSLACDLVKHNIRVNCICPGTVDTPVIEPMQRLGTSTEIASFVLTLAEDNGAYCTGGDYKIDGGLSI
ncbi:E1.1.1.30 [Lepeophtheirus salmonis]|uniref:Dehydrogenase/reductase SDR family member 6 n=1 Tax=Lepeophtheirus salmonis TaxID=72036 RepID=A0A7R8D6G9_LEPSM|nr:E1.1.1.30 [Lepeophtheirus salmonis]CAF3045015.1 E1.1.1.30 [Lepeophtheirus salmonis]